LYSLDVLCRVYVVETELRPRGRHAEMYQKDMISTIEEIHNHYSIVKAVESNWKIFLAM
jgi:hypothetical protein